MREGHLGHWSQGSYQENGSDYPRMRLQEVGKQGKSDLRQPSLIRDGGSHLRGVKKQLVNDSLGPIDTADSTGSDETKETGDAKKGNKKTRED